MIQPKKPDLFVSAVVSKSLGPYYLLFTTVAGIPLLLSMMISEVCMTQDTVRSTGWNSLLMLVSEEIDF